MIYSQPTDSPANYGTYRYCQLTSCRRSIVNQLTAVLIMEPTYIANYAITGERLGSKLTALLIMEPTYIAD